MVGSCGDSIVRMLCCICDIFTTDGEPAASGKLPYLVAVQSDFHGKRNLENYGNGNTLDFVHLVNAVFIFKDPSVLFPFLYKGSTRRRKSQFLDFGLELISREIFWHYVIEMGLLLCFFDILVQD